MKALGIYAGIGAMLIAFKKAGWDIVGNIEDRKIHTFTDELDRNTFTENFQEQFINYGCTFCSPGTIDVVASQPKCGGFSTLYGTGRRPADKTTAVKEYGAGLRMSAKEISRIGPKIFYVENLPKSLLEVSSQEWQELLPDYDLQFEYVSNYHYGNAQKGRNRFYLIGCHKDLDFIFIPREVKLGSTVEECIGDLLTATHVPNHEQHSRDDTDNLTNLAKTNRWGDIADYVLTLRRGENLPYLAKDGTIKRRIGSNVLHWDKHCHTLAGIKGAKFHPLTGMPLSIRERCRIQGYPDDFIIYGTKLNSDGTWTLRKNGNVVRQLNNTVPYQFTKEFEKQVRYYLVTGELIEKRPVRKLKTNLLIQGAKKDGNTAL